MKKVIITLANKASMLLMLAVTVMTITSCVEVGRHHHHYDDDEDYDEDAEFWSDPSLRPEID